MHPLLHPERRIAPCIIVCQISQLNPHVLIQSMGISFCIYRPINRQNTGYKYQIWAIDARNGLFCVILSDGSFHFPPFFSLLMAAFRGRNQRLIQEMHPTLDDSRVSSTMQGSVQSIAKQRLKHAHFIFLPAIRGRLKAESGSNTAYYHQTENMKTPIHRAHSAQ